MLIVFIGMFYFLNILNTYVVTTEVLNRYIVVFSRQFGFEINAILGNIAALTVFMFIGFLVFKSTRGRLLYLIILTFVLNFGIFGLAIFSKYYQTIFSFTELTLFNNPAQELAGSIFIESLKELIIYYRVIVFVPFLSLLTIYFFTKRSFKKDNLSFKNKMPLFNGLILNVTVLLAGFTLSIFSLGAFNISLQNKWPISTERQLYGVQSAGLYNFYFGQALGFDFQDQNNVEIDYQIYDQYNKNKASYTNVFGETYSNILTKQDAYYDFLDPSLDQEQLNGIFKDKNIVLFHLETFNHFLLDENGPYLDETYFKTFKSLLDESYVLDNFYTNVGLGNSSDAEFSVLTGLYPAGDTTLYWNYKNNNYTFDALPKLFTGRHNISFHGDVKRFYNRDVVHEQMFGFDKYYYYDKKESFYENTQNGYYLFPENNQTTVPESPWLCDYQLLEWLKAFYNQNKDQKLFYFPITIQPHTPYNYNPLSADELRFQAKDINVSETTLRFLNYEKYTDGFYEKFIEISKQMENTVYIFYGDHGSGIDHEDVSTILGKDNPLITDGNGKIDMLKYNQEMIKTIAFIYAPDDNDTPESGPKKGLLTGRQTLVRSQVDLYRTIIELCNLETDSYYYGVNALSKEHTFAIDTRTFTIAADDYFIIGKKMAIDKKKTKSNILFYNQNYLKDPLEFFEYVFTYKMHADRALNNNIYHLLKN